jgi:hypothetical protein
VLNSWDAKHRIPQEVKFLNELKGSLSTEIQDPKKKELLTNLN